jgi:hypothetical protein
LFIYKSPDVPRRKTYTIRPYLAVDESRVWHFPAHVYGRHGRKRLFPRLS